MQVDENNWLGQQIGVRTSICPTLHAKCYLNENQAIVTSMNLYSFSQQNNDEMGIHVTKEKDPDLYKDIYEEAQRLLTISKEIRVTVKTIEKEVESKIAPQPKSSEQKGSSKSKLLTTKEISQETGKSSRTINAWFVDNKLMYKKEDDWLITKKGKENGGVSKEGQYGKFIVWPTEIINDLKD